MIKTIALLVVAGLLGCITVKAQHQISGIVKAESGATVPYANVLLLALKDATMVKGVEPTRWEGLN